MKYVLYYLFERDISENDMYSDRRIFLKEVEDDSRFDTKEEAVVRAKSISTKIDKVTILEVY